MPYAFFPGREIGVSNPKIPRSPAGLGSKGRALWRNLWAEYEFHGESVAVLEMLCRQFDLNAALEEAIERDGLMVEGSQGQPTLNRAVSELRQGRLAAARLLEAVGIPADEASIRTAASRDAQRAANYRHRRNKKTRAAREASYLEAVQGGV